MKMTIDEKNKFIEESKEHFKEWHDMNYIPKADYENRLKADLKAILVELQLEIEEIVKEEELIDKKWADGLHYSEKIIQQKIDLLRSKD